MTKARQGRPKPPKKDRNNFAGRNVKQICVELRPDDVAVIDAEARQHFRTRSAQVRQIIQGWLADVAAPVQPNADK